VETHQSPSIAHALTASYKGMDEETMWIAADDLEHAPELTSLFHQHYLHKPGP